MSDIARIEEPKLEPKEEPILTRFPKRMPKALFFFILFFIGLSVSFGLILLFIKAVGGQRLKQALDGKSIWNLNNSIPIIITTLTSIFMRTDSSETNSPTAPTSLTPTTQTPPLATQTPTPSAPSIVVPPALPEDPTPMPAKEGQLGGGSKVQHFGSFMKKLRVQKNIKSAKQKLVRTAI